MVTDWGALYREHVADISALAGSLSEADQRREVPGSPAWSVLEVFAHLAGGPADQVTGRTQGAPGPEWTSRHVNERRHLPLADIVTELRSHQDAMVAVLVSDKASGPVWDIAVHHADLHEALGKHQLAEHLWRPVLDLLGPRRAAGILDQVAPYELFRGLFSRRSRAQMQAWGTGLSVEELDAICVFGPREDDQPVPA